MRQGSLFSGIGGFDLAAEWMGWENVFHCEWNEFGQKILNHYWPNAKSYGDITKTDFNIHRGRIDILTGGFPCQPYSSAGKRLGKEDDRHLWPEMLRAIREIRPAWVVGENVSGIVSWNGGLVFEEVQTDLENEGYEVQPILLPAASVGAQHQRERIWFISYSCSNERDALKSENCNEKTKRGRQAKRSEDRKLIKLVSGIGDSGVGFHSGHNIEPCVIRDSNGLSGRLDRLKSLGNAIDPNVAYQIFKTIEQFKTL